MEDCLKSQLVASSAAVSLLNAELVLLQIMRSHGLVMADWVILGEVVSLIGRSRSPNDLELSLGDTILDPKESHIHGLGAVLLDCVSGNGGVIPTRPPVLVVVAR